jgi:hypothetical protein
MHVTDVQLGGQVGQRVRQLRTVRDGSICSTTGTGFVDLDNPVDALFGGAPGLRAHR